jgi:hypothetical protein
MPFTAAQQKERRRRLRMAVIAFFGSKCATCGFDDVRALQIDHVFGGGCKERAERTEQSKYYIQVMKDTSGKYQLLCANCNWLKRFENNEEGGSPPQLPRH